jgi:hypothetical protein
MQAFSACYRALTRASFPAYKSTTSIGTVKYLKSTHNDHPVLVGTQRHFSVRYQEPQSCDASGNTASQRESVNKHQPVATKDETVSFKRVGTCEN